MQNDQTSRFRYLLAPIAFLYGLGVRGRNLLFDWGILRSERYDKPIICIGNVAVGGTGKTPHTEYIIRLLKDRYQVAVLSRGYKRRTKGYILASPTSTSDDIGDEPFQMKHKFPTIQVAVDANRRRGISNLLALASPPELILLDDAFQHRYVKPSLSVLLTDYHRLYTQDRLLPMGRLREPVRGVKRADVVIVTKCDPAMSAAERQAIGEDLCLSSCQKLYFSYVKYGDLTPLFPQEAKAFSWELMATDEEILLVSGIAHPEPLEEEVGRHSRRMISLTFPDHHAFTSKDIQAIQTAFDKMKSPNKRIIVTEKDAARLLDCPWLPKAWHTFLYCLPITICFYPQDGMTFDQIIENHIDERLKQR